MTQAERLDFMIRELMPEADIPHLFEQKWCLFRSLVNMRPAGAVSEEFLQIQNDFLQKAIKEKGITDADDLVPMKKEISPLQKSNPVFIV